jgi:predicted Zn-dependent protease
MIYSLGLNAGISLVFGNVDQNWGIRLAEHLGQLKFTREQESEADRRALDRLRASHIDPQGMRTFFKRLSKDSQDHVPALLTTHPHTADRLEVIDRLLAEMGPWPVETLPVDWPAVRVQIH